METGPLFHTPKVHATAAVRVNGALDKIFVSSMGALMEDFDKTTLSQVLKRVSKNHKK